MADDRNRDDEKDERLSGAGTDNVRGVAEEDDDLDEFDDSDDLDEEEDEESTTF